MTNIFQPRRIAALATRLHQNAGMTSKRALWSRVARAAALLALMVLPATLATLPSCTTPPDTQPLIKAAVELKRLEDAGLEKHRELARVARFYVDVEKNAEASAQYAVALERHAETHDKLVQAIIDWAQRVGQFDPNLANKTLDQVVDAYLRIETARSGNR